LEIYILATLFCEVHVQQKEPSGKRQINVVSKYSGVSFEGKSGTLRLIAHI
jgi:hypothetical protein